jgi:predicted  nucleic acid-binding Zn-ribbon protein
MEFEQIIKRLDWLDEQQRKDKNMITSLQERITSLEGELKVANKKAKEVGDSLSGLSIGKDRFEQVDSTIAKQRTDLTKAIDASEKRLVESQKEADKRVQVQFNALEKTIAELAKVKEPLAEIKRELKTRVDEDNRHNRTLMEWEMKLKEISETVASAARVSQSVEEARRQDNKRLTDLQGEIAATRKRLDEVRERTDLFNDSIRRIETRVNEMVGSEAERRQAQIAFIETQSRSQVERDRAWKDWEGRFESLRKQSELVETQLQSWDSAQRAVKRAQETYEEITQKFERRINEITEMQRLAEDRFRQEWVTFKSDDQKRWTSFTLSQEETHKDTNADIVKIDTRITSIEDLTQTHQDVLQQTKEANEQLLQAILAQIHEVLSAYDRIMGTSK